MKFNDFSNFGGSSDFANEIKKRKGLKRGIKIAAVILIAVIVLGTLGTMLMEYWQIKEINPSYVSVFYTNLWAKIITRAAVFAIFFAVLISNALALRKFAILKFLNVSLLKKKWPYAVVCIILALYAGRIAGNDLYLKLLSAINGQKFNAVDVLFSKDIGYYIFTRPFLLAIISGCRAFVMFQIIIMAVIYYFVFARNGYKNLKDIISTQAGAFAHIVVNIVVYFVLMILSYNLKAEELLYSRFGTNGDILGAGFIETNIYAVYYRIAPFVVLAVIVCVLIFLYKKRYMPVLFAIAVIPVMSLLVALGSYAADSLIVNPNERNIQSQYIKNNIDATLDAFNLSGVKDIEYSVKNDITPEDVINSKNEIDNIRITDFGASLTAYNQLQYFRKYYTFNDVDIVPYHINGDLKAIFTAAREMDKNNMDADTQSYANRMFRYTHGFGVVASPINRVTPEGQPEFIVKDIPPVSVEGLPDITQPRIYYGELTNDYVIVGGGNKELDYSEGVTDIEFSFDGETGINMTPFKRLMFAAYYGDYRMLFSGNINSESKLLINRNIVKRVQMAAPMLKYDDDPYIVIADDGTLKWIIDGYTTSSFYPYAQKYDGINYIRNSVKVIIDAYTGDMNFYIVDQNDPIAATYKKIYPDLFSDDPLPETVVDHITVPEYIFKLQRNVYQRYHVSDPGQFYDKADIWSVATEKYNNSDIEVEPYFNVMTIEDGKEELVLTTPFVLYGKYNMVGFLMARTVPEHYGELILYRMPKNMTVYGSMQVENRIDNDPEIAREMTLWNSGGSTVIRGNLLVVPFENSILYVEPVYIATNNTSSLPELKRIIVAYKDSIAMESTLSSSLAKVLGGSVPESESIALPNGEDTGETIQNAEDAIQNVIDSYEKFRQAIKSSEWTKMGESLDELDGYINALKEQN